jgi:hypothetical protein
MDQSARFIGGEEYMFFIIASYELDGELYYDTRIYKKSDDGYVPDHALMKQLNDEYFDVDDYPVEKIIMMPSDVIID